MDRRYYLVKVAVVVLAIVTAAITSAMNSRGTSHAITEARYSAPATIEAAAWRSTAWIAHTVGRLFGSEINLPQ